MGSFDTFPRLEFLKVSILTDILCITNAHEFELNVVVRSLVHKPCFKTLLNRHQIRDLHLPDTNYFR